MYQRTYTDLVRTNPLMNNLYYEYEHRSKLEKPTGQPPRMRTWKLIKIPNMFDEDPMSQPRFRWVSSEWHHGKHTDEMKEWNVGLISVLNRMQGAY